MSPIKGLTDRQAGFPQIGTIRKGGPKEKNRPGPDLKYFRFDFDEQEEEARKMVLSFYGPEPDEIDIVLPFETVEENFEAWMEAYLAGGLIYRSDGEKVIFWLNYETGMAKVKGGDPPTPANDKEPVCVHKRKKVFAKPYGRLKVVLPVLNRFAYLVATTGSYHDCANLSSQLEALRLVNGIVAGIPLKLRRRPVKITTPDPETGKKIKREKWLLSVEADPNWVRQKLIEGSKGTIPAGLLEGGGKLDMPAPPPVEDDHESNGDLVEGTFTNVADDPASQFWHMIYSVLKWERDQAMEIVDKFDGDYEKALTHLRANEPLS